LAELKLTPADIRLILKALLTGQFDLGEQKDAFNLYNRLVAANNETTKLG
jgi:hypothetical protein